MKADSNGINGASVMIDLQPFCANRDTRNYLKQPFSRGEYTYASNGHIMVRVPRRPDAAEVPEAAKAETVYASSCAASFEPVPTIELPELTETVEKEECEDCDGEGHEHDCPDCQCNCFSCGGTGEVEHERSVTVGIKGAFFSRKYVALILGLPGLQFGPIKKDDPLHFRFEGGDGLLMPRRTKADNHFDILD